MPALNACRAAINASCDETDPVVIAHIGTKVDKSVESILQDEWKRKTPSR